MQPVHNDRAARGTTGGYYEATSIIGEGRCGGVTAGWGGEGVGFVLTSTDAESGAGVGTTGTGNNPTAGAAAASPANAVAVRIRILQDRTMAATVRSNNKKD